MQKTLKAKKVTVSELQNTDIQVIRAEHTLKMRDEEMTKKLIFRFTFDESGSPVILFVVEDYDKRPIMQTKNLQEARDAYNAIEFPMNTVSEEEEVKEEDPNEITGVE